MPGKGMPETGVGAGDGSCLAPAWEHPWPGAMCPALLCCRRDLSCQFQNVSSPGGTFPAMRLCNNYWSREVRGGEQLHTVEAPFPPKLSFHWEDPSEESFPTKRRDHHSFI